MKHFKTLVFNALSLIIIAFAVGCNGDKDAEGRELPTIRFWHFWSEPSQREALLTVVNAFEKEHGVKVELTELSWNDGKAKLQAAFNSGNPPDVIELGSDWIAQFSSAGVLMELPSTADVLGKFIDNSVEPGMWQGKAYAYPWTVDTRVLYVNYTMLEGSGWKKPVITTDDLLAAARSVQSNGEYGYGANGADAHRLYKKVLPLMWTAGGSIFSKDGKPNLNSPENVQAFTLMLNLARTGFIETQRQLDAAFLQGRIAFWISGSWILDRLTASNKFKFGVELLPGQNGQPGQSFMGGEYLSVAAASKSQSYAKNFVEYMTKGKNSVKFCLKVNEAGFPADTTEFNNAELVRTPAKKVFAQQLLHARMTPVHPRWLDIEEVVEEAAVTVLLGNATPQDALDAAQRDLEEIIGGN